MARAPKDPALGVPTRTDRAGVRYANLSRFDLYRSYDGPYMIRSSFAVGRLIVAPYAVLLAMYMVVVGGGGTWLYFQVRAVETRLLVEELMALAEPLAEKLSGVDAMSLVDRREPWLMADVRRLFTDLPALRQIFLRDRQRGLAVSTGPTGEVLAYQIGRLSRSAGRVTRDVSEEQRLLTESDAAFLIRFDLAPETAPPVRLGFRFDRPMLLARIEAALAPIERAVVAFGLVGGVSILIALGITAFAMRATRRIEAHYQALYQRASLTQLATEFVHDLRNPLMKLRTNVKALLVSPQETREIIADMDQDILSLNDKLTGFLKLTRDQGDKLEPIAIEPLIEEAVHLSGPALDRNGLSVAVDIPPGLPRPVAQREAIRDALVNVIVNAAESGQREGAIRVEVRAEGATLTIAVEDRGGGIAAEDLPHLFDPYYTTKVDGNGLGLAIVRRILAHHHGEVRAENRREGGARVLLKLPLTPREAPRWWRLLRTSSPI